jgi:pyruvate-ferredoxin/flavodoxin oxidoreductase
MSAPTAREFPSTAGGAGARVARAASFVDGNEAAASVAYRTSEVIAIYPITPSSPMGEIADERAARHEPNLWGIVPRVVEMQSEGGAAGAVHGALQAGALSTTFTSSQGLLLMIPNMYKIAGELTPTVFHVAARAIATHALSIFGDHSDIYACRQTGFAFLGSASPQEAHDLACIAHAATLRSRIPFVHFFDGFRTSHEIGRVEILTDDDLRFMIDEEMIRAHRARALTPDRPVVRGTAQNPDTFFQAREAVNPYYEACPPAVQAVMDRFAARTGRRYGLFDYVGHAQAERVIVAMGSACESVQELVEWMVSRGERVGLVKVRLFRPFDVKAFLAALPPTVRSIAVLDRAKEPGAIGEPLYMDVIAALTTGSADGDGAPRPRVIGGRYGLASKDLTSAMIRAVYEELGRPEAKRQFTVGIVDDVTHTSLPFDRTFDIEPDDVFRGVFFGLGSDGTVGAAKNSIKIIGEATGRFAQAYFVYDSKKSGTMTVSHLRFGPRPIRSTYLVSKASFVACHQWSFFERHDMLGLAAPGATVLLNAPFPADEIWDRLPLDVQETVLEKGLALHAIDAAAVAKETGLGSRINSIMQTAFFVLSGILPKSQAIAKIKEGIEKTYRKKGDEVVRRNLEAVDRALTRLHRVPVPGRVTATRRREPLVPEEAPAFVRGVTSVLMEGKGDLLPVSAFPPDGTWPTGTAKWEKRNIALEIPVWDTSLCIQCNKCALVCPHAAIRAKVYPPEWLAGAPPGFVSMAYKGHEFDGATYTIQVAPEDCTGCALCVEICPAVSKGAEPRRALAMREQAPLREAERENFAFFLRLPEPDRRAVKSDVKGSQFLQPLFEFSGACPGCGEAPYIKLLTQLYGDRLLIANATGCSSIYGGNLPTTPYTTNEEGRGPAWTNSLFEDNAEFGFGLRLAADQLAESARGLLAALRSDVGEELARALLDARQDDERGVEEQRARVKTLRERLAGKGSPLARRLGDLADYLVRKSVWIVGGDGWAYDIGFGGLDHVLASGEDVNILVLDTEVYSNTGGQASKATPLGAAAKFAMSGKETGRKDLGLMAMTYGHVYVAQVALGAKDAHTLKAIQEAEAHRGPSLLIAYSPCITHGYDIVDGPEHTRLAVGTGFWPLYRFDPRRAERGENPFQLDSKPPARRFMDQALVEGRFRMVLDADPERGQALLAKAQEEIAARWASYERLAGAWSPSTRPEAPDKAT